MREAIYTSPVWGRTMTELREVKAPAYIRWSTLMQEGTFFNFEPNADDNPKIQIALKELKKNTGTGVTVRFDYLVRSICPRAAHAPLTLWSLASLAGGRIQRAAVLPVVFGGGSAQVEHGGESARPVDQLDAAARVRARGQEGEQEEGAEPCGGAGEEPPRRRRRLGSVKGKMMALAVYKLYTRADSCRV